MYRLYFRDSAGICGRVELDADDDWAATISAELLADACSDRCTGFELWQGARLLRHRRTLPPFPPITLSQLSERVQAIVVETEEAIKSSAFAIAGSRQLLERLNQSQSKQQSARSDRSAWGLTFVAAFRSLSW